MRYPAMQKLFYNLRLDPKKPTAANAGVTLLIGINFVDQTWSK